MREEEFSKELKKIGITISPLQFQLLNKYYSLLIEWNNNINLTRIIEYQQVLLKHFYDSLTINKIIDLNDYQTLCDIGTGAGFPGIVLKIFYPHLKITLVDSLSKRINFLKSVINELNLKDIVAIHSRSEDLKNKYDVVVTRAVASLPKLIPMCKHLLDFNSNFIIMKANCEEELDLAIPIMTKNHLYLANIIRFNLPIENSVRTLINLKSKK